MDRSATRIPILLLLLLKVISVKCLTKVSLDEDGNFVDADGYFLLFHGINSVIKYPPWYDENLLNHTRIEVLQKWGLNVIRLGVMWSGVMPNQSEIDVLYLNKLEQIVNLCANNGIYVILDMHQDVMSSEFGLYDGIPKWLVDQLPEPPSSLAYPFPFTKIPSNWAFNYLTYAAASCAQNLYENCSGTWNYWGDFWAAVAQRFQTKTNVLGYELINEPPIGNFYTNPFNLLPGFMGKSSLLPVYDYLVKRIRQVDKQTLIFYEPVTYSLILDIGLSNTGTGFSRVPGAHEDPEERNRSVLSFHYYCWLLDASNTSTNMTPFEQFACDKILINKVFQTAHASRQKTGGGIFLTEFGLCFPDGNPHSVNTIECNTVLQKADEKLQSWTYWGDDILMDRGEEDYQILSFIRPYPLKTFGFPEIIKFDIETGDFHYAFQTKPEEDKTENLIITEIFLPIKQHYPKGPIVHVQPNFLLTEIMGNILRLHIPDEMRNVSISVTVNVTKSLE